MVLEGPTNGHPRTLSKPLSSLSVDGMPENRGEGFYPQSSTNGRFRVVLDVEKYPEERLEQMGATEISLIPIALEDLFVALVTGE